MNTSITSRRKQREMLKLIIGAIWKLKLRTGYPYGLNDCLGDE